MQSVTALQSEAARPPFPRVTTPTAIVHDWFQGYGGAERVVDVMRSGLFAPDNRPDVYTFHAARELLPPDLVAAIVKESRLSRFPGVRQRGHDPGRWRYLLPHMPRYFRKLDLHRYEIVIASSWAFAVHARPRPDALYVCYCYTPIRYVWLPEIEAGRTRGLRRVALRSLTGHLKRLDLEASRRPDAYVAISEAVRERVKRFYGRDATVVHPPVDVDEFEPRPARDPHRFLWVHRLVSYKNPELVVEAFRGLPYSLTMVGVGPLESRIRRNLPANVELRGWVDRAELRRLYADAAGFLHVGEEDFGISMVEALASGTPVVALDRGGARDIVRHERDGLLIDAPKVERIREAAEAVAATAWDPRALAERASQFSTARFLERFGAFLHGLTASHGDR